MQRFFILTIILFSSCVLYPQEETRHPRKLINRHLEIDDSLGFTSSNPADIRFLSDYTYHYTAGLYSKWECEETTGAGIAGIRHDYGGRTENAWYSGSDSSNIGRRLIYGPFHNQHRTYDLYYIGSLVTYTLNIAVYKDFEIPEENKPLLRINIIDESLPEKDDTLKSIIIKEDKIPSSPGKPVTLRYRYRSKRDSISIDEKKEKTVPPEMGKLNVEVIRLDNVPVSVDYIEIYDSYIWSGYIHYPSAIEESITLSLRNYPKNAFYNFEWNELKSIDSYVPYKIIDSIINRTGAERLNKIQYPKWLR